MQTNYHRKINWFIIIIPYGNKYCAAIIKFHNNMVHIVQVTFFIIRNNVYTTNFDSLHSINSTILVDEK